MLRKIIHTFLYNSLPENVQRQFWTWCLGNENAAGKEEILWQEWLHLEPDAILPADNVAYRRKLERLHREMGTVPIHRIFGIGRRAATAAAAVVLLVMGVEYFAVRHLAADHTILLMTAENSKGRFMLPDSTVVWLNADSRLSYPERFTGSGNRSVRLEGEAFFDVKRDSRHPFEVTMGALKVKVLGTRFNASYIPEFKTEEVTLQTGKVELTGFRAGRKIVLKPDQSCAYDANSGNISVKDVAAGNYCSWTGDSNVFENRTLADILTNLEHWYNIRFRIGRDVDTTVRLSFTLRPETLEETLGIIETLTRVECERIDKHHVSIHNKNNRP